MLSLTSLLFAYLFALTHPFTLQQTNINIDNTLLIIAVSTSIIILVILAAIAHVTAKKRALDQLFDEFTGNQEDWLNNRLEQRAKHLVAQNLALIQQSTALLTIQKQNQAHLQALNLFDTIDAVQSELRTLLKEPSQSIQVSVPSDLSVTANPMLLKHLLLQLLLELMQQADTNIIVAATRLPEKECIQLSLRPVEKLSHQLEEKNLTRPYPNGVLAFCQMAIASFGGTIEAATTPEKGVTYHLQLAAVIDGPSPQSGSLMQLAQSGGETTINQPGQIF
ncbi:MAG: hypothetical protein HEP71_24950 [Roseivirga sp.]|nr:hypothetical protein [Roseivirga sp.]